MLVISPHTTYAAKRLVEEAEVAGLELCVMSVEDLVAVNFKLDINEYSVLYVRNPYLNGSPEYLPQVVDLAKQFKAAGKKVVDSNITEGKLGTGKWEDYLALEKGGLLIPQTDLLSGYKLPTTNYPLILKWIYGFKARNVFLVNDENQLTKLLPQHPHNEWLVQEFIKAEYEYKVITVGYKALPVVLRFGINENGFRTDFASACSVPIHGLSGTPINRHATTITRLAETASKALGRELSKVDILQKGNQLYILEVNRFPGLDTFEQLTKFNVIKHFLDYLQK